MIDQLVRANIAQLKSYSSARDEFKDMDNQSKIFIDANENPFENGVNRYPDPHQLNVKKIIAAQKNITIDSILLGNGSDEVLDLLFRAFCEPKEDEIIITPPTYGMYEVLANINNVAINKIQLEEDFSIDAEKIIKGVKKNTKIIFLRSPNNPTANNLSIEAIEKILQNIHCLLVVDEAYIDFSTQISCTHLLAQYPNLIICQTLSKAYGMAGIRLGMCFASPAIINILKKIKPPYNINTLTQQKAIELLQNTKLYEQNLAIIIEERERLLVALQTIHYIEKIFPTDANFILIKVDDANKRYQEILDKGIVVRNRSQEPLCYNCLRITIGTKRENDELINSMKKIN